MTLDSSSYAAASSVPEKNAEKETMSSALLVTTGAVTATATAVALTAVWIIEKKDWDMKGGEPVRHTGPGQDEHFNFSELTDR